MEISLYNRRASNSAGRVRVPLRWFSREGLSRAASFYKAWKRACAATCRDRLAAFRAAGRVRKWLLLNGGGPVWITSRHLSSGAHWRGLSAPARWLATIAGGAAGALRPGVSALTSITGCGEALRCARKPSATDSGWRAVDTCRMQAIMTRGEKQ